MVNLTIIDSGYLKIDNSGTRLSTANRANSGNLISTPSSILTFSAKANLDASPTIGTFALTEVNYVSFDNPQFTLTVRIDKTNSDEMDLIFPLYELIQTKGYKVMFYNGSAGNDRMMLPKIAGSNAFSAAEKTDYSLSDTYKKVDCRFISFTPKEDSKSKQIVIMMAGVLTG